MIHKTIYNNNKTFSCKFKCNKNQKDIFYVNCYIICTVNSMYTVKTAYSMQIYV